MGKPKLSESEKQWRKEQRAKTRADRQAVNEQLKLRAKRAKALRKLVPHWKLNIEWCTSDAVGLVLGDQEVNYDRLIELSMLFNSSAINIGTDTVSSCDTFENYDEARLTIVISNVDWSRVDKV